MPATGAGMTAESVIQSHSDALYTFDGFTDGVLMDTVLPEPETWPTMLSSPTTLAVCAVDVTPAFSRSCASSESAPGSAFRSFDSAASAALRLSASSGAFSRSFTASVPAGDVSLPFTHCQTD